MKTSRRSAVLSFILLAAASAASAQVAADVYLPNPNPPCNKYIEDCPPKPCTNIYDGCEPMVPHPMKDVSDKTAGIATSIGKGDFTKASEGLDGLFSGSGIKAGGKNVSSNGGTVYAGTWKAAPRLLLGTQGRSAARAPLKMPRINLVGGARVVLAADTDANPLQHDNRDRGIADGAVTGVMSGAAGGGARGGVVGAVAGGAIGGVIGAGTGAVNGASQDRKEKATADQKSYDNGTAAWKRDHNGN
jgi:hypothetical protein